MQRRGAGSASAASGGRLQGCLVVPPLPPVDSQSFTRLTTSLGVLLCALALVAPLLLLRETAVLRISERELKGLTPVGRKEIERRQQLATDVGRKAWLIGGGLAVVGIGLLIYSLPRLRKREATEDRRSQAELDQLIRKQDPRQREESAEREASEELAAQLAGHSADDVAAPRSDEETVTAVQAGDEPEEGSEGRDDRAEEREEGEAEPDLIEAIRASMDAVRERDASSEEDSGTYEDEGEPDLMEALRRSLDAVRERTTTVEERVVSHVRSIAPPWYHVREFVNVGSGLQLDALLASDIDQMRDIVVEVCLVRNKTLSTRLSVVADRAIAHAARYSKLTRRAAAPWLIVVVEDVLYLEAVRERVARIIEPLEDQAIISLISEPKINELRFPPNLSIGPRGAA